MKLLSGHISRFLNGACISTQNGVSMIQFRENIELGIRCQCWRSCTNGVFSHSRAVKILSMATFMRTNTGRRILYKKENGYSNWSKCIF